MGGLFGLALASFYDLSSSAWVYASALLNQLEAVKDLYTGDYYPLTPYSLENDVWMAWQFDRPDLGQGVVQVFRRPDSPYESARFHLRGLDPDAKYEVTNLDTNRPEEMAGRELTATGLLVSAPQRPAALLITYRKMP